MKVIKDEIIRKKLSPQEDTVLKMYAKGNIAKQIANNLSISESTVKTYNQRILAKLQANNIYHAIGIYAKAKLLN